MTTPSQRSARYATTAIVLVHLVVTLVHGWAHSQLQIGLTTFQTAFVAIVVVLLPLLALGLAWTAKVRDGLGMLSASMFAALLFGVFHHFWMAGPDNVHSQAATSTGSAFVITAYGLLITEAIGTYVGIHFLRGE